MRRWIPGGGLLFLWSFQPEHDQRNITTISPFFYYSRVDNNNNNRRMKLFFYSSPRGWWWFVGQATRRPTTHQQGWKYIHSFPVYVSCTVVDNAFICHSGNIVIPLANEWIPLSFAVVCLVERHTGTKKKKRKSPPRVSRIKPSVSWHISSSSLSWWMVAVSAVNPICAVWSSEEQFLLYRNLLLFAILTFHKLPLQWLVPVSRHSVGVAINYISSVTQCDDTM